MPKARKLLEKMIRTKYDREYKDLWKKVMKEVPWDKPPEEATEGATRYVVGHVKGQEYWISISPPNSSYTGGWVFEHLSIGDPYSGKKMFTKSGKALTDAMSGGRPIDWIRGYQKSDDLIKKNLVEFGKALAYLKAVGK